MPDLDSETLESHLLRLWGLRPDRIEPLEGGMNSRTWQVDGRYVAKLVTESDVDDLVAGARAASHLAAHGIRTGAPIPTLTGEPLSREVGLALLAWVPGRALMPASEADQHRMAETLAGVHLAGGASTERGTGDFMSEWLDAVEVDAHPWLVRAIDEVRRETSDLELTWTLLHTDPTPEAFLYDEASGVTGLIDWAGSRRGPALYDVASAVMYLGGRASAEPFLGRYARLGVLSDLELDQLEALGRFRWTVQGAYFARRIASHDLVGVAGPAENHEGLGHARRALDPNS